MGVREAVMRRKTSTDRSPRRGVRAFRLAAAFAAVLCAWGVPGAAHAQREPVPRGDGLAAIASGWVEFTGAYTTASPAHASMSRLRAEIASKGEWDGGLKWKASARGYYDAVYDTTNFYPSSVRHDQGSELMLHEAYVDFARGDWEFRLGKQNIVWGEMVGLFFADVVSARDMRQFLLQDFDRIRIPQWAARAEWFGGDDHFEFVWLPMPEVDRIGVPGAEFFSYPMRYEGLEYRIDAEQMPAKRLSNGGAGARWSTLVDGWDVSAFAFSAIDTSPAYYRSLLAAPAPTVSYQARHNRVNRFGGTVSKDFDGVVVRAELAYSSGKQFALLALPPDSGSGLAKLDVVDWALGADVTPADGWRVNGQVFQRAFVNYTPDIGLKRYETGVSLLVSYAITPTLDAEVLGITSVVREDWMARASLTWKASRASRVRLGADAFGGDAMGLFGQYRYRDRVYVEYLYTL